ncbi:MAG: hypothetical protein M5U13_06060 [Thermoanaerobaculia bacterium]|nr:hypothetical protein [Thermoanaerobaculia bacterium]
MSIPESPATPPVRKKGLHPLAWVAIGCGGLLLLVLIGFFAAGAFVVNKAKGWVEQAEQNPALAAAEMVVRMNPDLSLVSKDEDAGTMTVRDKKSGETVTLSFEDIAEGRFSFEKDGERTEIRVGQEKDGGGLRIEGPDGQQIVFGASADREKIPGWVPLYPGATFEGQGIVTAGDSTQGTFAQLTTDRRDEVVAFFRARFEEIGIPIQTVTAEGTGSGDATWLTGTVEGRSLSVHVGATEEGRTAVQVTFAENP